MKFTFRPAAGMRRPALALAFLVLGAAGARGEETPLAQRYLPLAEERYADKNYLGAAFLYERILSEDSTNVEVLHRLGASYREMGKSSYSVYFDKAWEVYRRLERVVGQDDRRYREAMAIFYSSKWDMDSAISVYEGLLGEYPDDCHLWIKLADSERLKGIVVREAGGLAAEEEQLLKAEDLYRKILERCPDRLEPYHGLAIIQNVRREYKQTANMYAGLLVQHPGNVELLRGKTVAEFSSRNWDDAAVGLKELLTRDPRDDERLQYISVLRKLGRMEEAEEQSRIYKETAPKLYGPDPLLPIDVLRQELAIQSSVERAVALAGEKKFGEAVAVLKEARGRVEPRLESEDPEARSAAEDLITWLDRRIAYFEKQKAEAAP